MPSVASSCELSATIDGNCAGLPPGSPVLNVLFICHNFKEPPLVTVGSDACVKPEYVLVPLVFKFTTQYTAPRRATAVQEDFALCLLLMSPGSSWHRGYLLRHTNLLLLPKSCGPNHERCALPSFVVIHLRELCP